MEDIKSNKSEYCLGCLCHNGGFNLQCYKFQTETLKTLFQADHINFCYICKSLVLKAEQFIQNVQSNQIFMENFQNITDSAIESARMEFTPTITLSNIILDPIELTDNNKDIDEPIYVIYSKCKNTDSNIKSELKDEEVSGHIEVDFVDDNDFQGSFIKDEDEDDDFPLKTYIKDENSELLEVNVKKLKKALKTSKVKTISNQSKDEAKNIDKRIIVKRITREQCMRERSKMKNDSKYLNSVYKCADCIKGFTFKESYEKHMEKHSKAMGKYQCDICKQRMDTMDKLLSHQRYHSIRYKCSECNLTRISRLTIKDHYSAYHLQGPFLHECLHCKKMFKRQVSLKKHIAYSHMTQNRSKCKICQKTYVNKEGLKTHMIDKHPSEVTSGTIKKHVCAECGTAFKAPSQLRNHMVKHSGARNHYCVECDKGFKSYNALKQHLKVATPHVNYLELPLKCDHCDRRFSVRRDLERHSNRVHLNIKPFQCDKCDKAYVNLWSLTEHKRFTHEGHKRPLNFPCPFCDKVFNRNATRKSHIRTHTGERPFACSICPAKFSQAGVLGTHVRLVHLKLTRDGRPKDVTILPN
ncbi:unnamed protein product [Euphydryas editha]|uniref:C2H2-type domain-containing protein n=1 Tax=Euphydryas editha TaxID=104508 RepID=A0AAU9UI60_EUPED|nr:unnamed protein product [Euphydryas editha]